MMFLAEKLNRSAAVLLLVAAAGCSPADDQLQEPLVVSAAESDQNLPAEIDFDPKGSSSERIDEAINSVEKVTEKPSFVESDVGDEISHATTESIPIEINADVQRWLDFFTMKDRERFKRFLERGSRYKNMIHAVLKEQGVPTELYYQAMIESGFAVHATSIASAVGIWQFIPGTGRRYGLRIDHYVDERRDPMRATIAAAMYLKDLNNVFQNWYLAMAAYNAGEGRILGAIMRSNTRDFWEMVRKHSLPSETLNYIPKFIAATTIGHNLERYGFEDLVPEIAPQLVAVNVPSPVKLTDIARVSGLSLAVITEYNPHFRRGITPPGQNTYRIWVPKEYQDEFNSKFDELAALRIKNMRNVAAATDDTGGKTSVTHKVKKGENLASISRKYEMSSAAIKKLNNLKSNRIYVGMYLKISGTAVPPTKSSSRSVTKSASDSSAEGSSPKAHTMVKYRVKHGDNLQKIAKKFNTSIPEIKKLNNMKRNSIATGQILRVNDRKG